MTQLETITASLANGYKQLQPDTFQTSAEITTARREDITSDKAERQELRTRCFWTANLGLYGNNGKELQYGIGGRQTFNAIAGPDIDEFCRQLTQTDKYHLTEEQAQSLDASGIVWANPADLRLKGTEKEWRYFEISPSNPDNLNQAQRALAEASYGQGDDFVGNMNMLAEARTNPKIYVLNPEYVMEETEQGEVIARACWLGGFYNDSKFDANSRDVNNSNGLRGVRLVREADEQKIEEDPITSAYHTLLIDPKKSAERLSPDTAAGIADILRLYLILRSKQ